MPARIESQNFEQFEEAHQQLMAAYVKAHREASDKIWARPVVDGHIRRRLEDLRDSYLQARDATFLSERHRNWLNQEADELDKRRTTYKRRWDPEKYMRGVNTFFGIPAVAVVLSTTGVSAAALAILQSCLCHLLLIVGLILPLALYLTFCEGYDAKRQLFLDEGIYVAEDHVFSALGERKDRERALDVTGFFLITTVVVTVGILEESAIHKGLVLNPLHWMIWVGAGGLALATAFAFRASRVRKPA